jgi:malate dehydrogenase (oxaloacetate-decarboxylating)(NADP+)
LSARLDPTASFLQEVFKRITPENRRVVFTEGEEEVSIRAALAFRNSGYGHPVLLGREARIKQRISDMGLDGADDLEIINAKISDHNKDYIGFLYKKLHRRGTLQRDCQRMVNHDRNVFAACMVANGHADALVTGMTRSFQVSFNHVTSVIRPKKGKEFVTTSMLISRGRTVFMGDTSIHERPTGEQMADIAEAIAEKARSMGHVPRVAILSFSNFGSPDSKITQTARDAVATLDQRKVKFEYEGEMTADIALDYDLMQARYPFSRLTGPANILVMPGLHSANISFKLMQQLGGGTVIGPMILNGEFPFQIIPMSASVNDLVNAASLAAYESLETRD